MAESFGRSRVPEVLSPAQANDKFAARLRGFGPIGLLAILIILGGNFITPPLSAILVLIWVKISDTPWREIGYVRPRSWGKAIATGIVFGVALKFVMKAMVMPLFGAPPTNQAYHFVTGNPAVIPMMIYTMIIIAGFGEETFYRGWMFERFGKLLGQSLFAKIAIVVITSILCVRSLSRARNSGGRTSVNDRIDLWLNLRRHRADFHVNDRSRGIRFDRTLDDLLRPRNAHCASHLPLELSGKRKTPVRLGPCRDFGLAAAAAALQ